MSLISVKHESTCPSDQETLDSLLLSAVSFGNKGMILACIENGASVDSIDARGLTPLMHAARKGDAGIVRMLLDAGADATRLSPGGQTALTMARGKMLWRVCIQLAPYSPVSEEMYREFDLLVNRERARRSPANTRLGLSGFWL